MLLVSINSWVFQLGEMFIAFRIADTFTGSLAKLTGEEQKAVKTTAFDLQMNPAHPGMQLHKIDRAKDKNFNGPARVAGSAGTGKTVVALHRAVHLVRTHRDARVLLATFSETLAEVLRIRMTRLISDEPRLADRLEVHSMSRIARRLYEANLGTPVLATAGEVRELLDQSAMALSKRPGGATGSVAVGTMHLAKGLEFRAVVVAGCDDEVLPLQSRIESVVDEADL